MPRKPKRKVTVELPAEFVDFMRHVNELIRNGDEIATTLESDDLLQCDHVYGGLYTPQNGDMGFVSSKQTMPRGILTSTLNKFAK